MADSFVPKLLPRDLTVDDSTQATEPFPPGFVEARLENVATTAPLVDEASAICLNWSTLSQHNAPQLEGAWMLLYPKVKGVNIHQFDGTGSFGPWIDAQVDNQPSPVKVLVVAPGIKDLGCTVSRRDAFCAFYFDPRHDSIYLVNQSSKPFFAWNDGLRRSCQIEWGKCAELFVGTWNLVFEGESILGVQVLKRKGWPVTHESKKRAASADGSSSKKLKVSNTRGAVVNNSPLLMTSENALVKLKQGMKILVGPRENGYWLTRLQTIFENSQSAVWRGRHSSAPDTDIVVKVVKIHRNEARTVIRTAQRWMQEHTLHSCLKHSSIVRLLGFDARFHCLYLEHIDGKSLSRLAGPNYAFTGTPDEAQRIIENLASALSHVHEKNIVHADLKPGNVLYSPERGAVLIDFGLSFRVGNAPVSGGGGTPWYVPPEYAEKRAIQEKSADIWALGVTMLWLMNYMPLPEYTGENWRLRDIDPEGTSPDAHKVAVTRMKIWINGIKDIRKALARSDDKLHQIVGRTLEFEASDRITAESLCQELRGLRLSVPQDNKALKPTEQRARITAVIPSEANITWAPTTPSRPPSTPSRPPSTPSCPPRRSTRRKIVRDVVHDNRLPRI